jgi:translation initiation factor IF-3
LSRPFPSRSSNRGAPQLRVNGRIRAREVRVVGAEGQQLGVITLGEAINMARAQGVDLVEVAPNANPPVCRLVDYGRFRYEQAKREKESKKHQHASKLKEIQLTATIDDHDLAIKVSHAIDFLCDDMKVKASLRFRGREMAHKEFGFQVVERFVKQLAPFGSPDAPAKLVGRSVNVMFTPLPRNKRAKNPNASATSEIIAPARPQTAAEAAAEAAAETVASAPAEAEPTGFSNNPFANLEDRVSS